MFKNTTRRGLAIGAALSLALSGLVSAPAQAAGEVVFVPSAGTSYTTLVTEAFTLQASLAPGQVPSTAEQLKYKIDKAAGSTVSYGVSTSSSVTAGTTLNAASTSVVVAATGAGALTQNFVQVKVTDATSVSPSVDVTVTAFIDSNNNSTLDSGEFSTARTVSFKKFSEVASVVTITQPAQGDTSVKGTATLTDINRSQVQGAVEAVITVGGAAQAAVSVSADASYTVANQTIGATTTVSAVVNVRTFQIGSAAATVTATPRTVQAVTASAVAGDNAKNTAAGAADVRLNSAYVVAGNVKNGTTDTASAVAGAAVTATVTTSATLSTTKTVTLNGTTYTSSTTLAAASLALTSDASGNALVNVSTAGFVAADKLTFVFKSQNLESGRFETTAVAADYDVKADGTGYLTVAPSGAVNAAYTVKDQFGVNVPAGHRLVVTFDGSTKYVNLVDGKTSAAFTATSSTTAATYDAVATQLEKQNTTTLNWEADATANTGSQAVTVVKVTTVASKFDVAPTHSATTTISRVVTTSPGLNNALQITGTVNHAGDKVTVTAAGVKFSSDGKTLSDGTISVNAAGNGQFTISAYVSKAGDATFNYTVGAATASTKVTVAAATGREGSALDVTSNAVGNTIEPGKTIVAKISLKDEFGNPVAADDAGSESFGVTVTGLGFVGALPTKLNSSGEATVTVLLGSADEGNVVITATYSKDGSTANAITKVLTIAVAKAAAPEVNAVIGSYLGRWAVRVENAKGSVVSVKVGGNWYKYTSLNENYLFSRKSVVGRTLAVAVYVNGQLENVSTITVK